MKCVHQQHTPHSLPNDLCRSVGEPWRRYTLAGKAIRCPYQHAVRCTCVEGERKREREREREQKGKGTQAGRRRRIDKHTNEHFSFATRLFRHEGIIDMSTCTASVFRCVGGLWQIYKNEAGAESMVRPSRLEQDSLFTCTGG